MVQQPGVWVGDCEDGVEDCGEVEGVEGGGEGGDDDGVGLGEAGERGSFCEIAT